MVSSDFGKLEVRRHLISGDDCAMAGEATAVAAAPAAETFKKSRRFIKASPCWGVSHFGWNSCGITFQARRFSRQIEGAARWFTRSQTSDLRESRIRSTVGFENAAGGL